MLVKRSIRPIAVTFSPKWYNKNFGMDFSEPAWADPIKRTELGREMRETVIRTIWRCRDR